MSTIGMKKKGQTTVFLFCRKTVVCPLFPIPNFPIFIDDA